METSILIARIAAVAYLTTGVALLNDNLDLEKAYVELKKTPLYTVMLGMFTLFLGMLIVNLHNVWRGWPILVTLIGWVLLVEGIFYIAWPQALLGLFMRLPKGQVGWGIFTILFGLLFSYFGFLVA